MIPQKVRKVIYDGENDIVYIAFSNQNNSYGDDISENIIIRRDWDNDEITGVTIQNFMKLLNCQSAEMEQLPVAIDFETAVLPFCTE